MHTKPMSEDEGELNASVPTDRACPQCRAQKTTRQTWESSCGGYEDDKYTCGACGHVWWIDGIDS